MYNPVIPMVIFRIPPPLIFFVPSFAWPSRIPNPELQIREIPDTGKPIGDAHWKQHWLVSVVYKRVWKHNNILHNTILVRTLRTGKHKRRYDNVYWKQNVLKFFFPQPFEPEWILLVRLQITLRIFFLSEHFVFGQAFF